MSINREFSNIIEKEIISLIIQKASLEAFCVLLLYYFSIHSSVHLNLHFASISKIKPYLASQ